MKRFFWLIIILLGFLLILILPKFIEFDQKIANILAISFLIFCLWISEIIPIPVTSLLPIVLMPTFGILSINESVINYSNQIIFLFLAGFLIALSICKWNLDKRISLLILKYIKKSYCGIVAGLMISTFLLSMWVSNTASTLMMLPIALSIIKVCKIESGNDKFAKIILLAIAYSASIGGISTIIGTPTNAIAVSYLENNLNYSLNLAFWLRNFLPLALILLFFTWFYLAFFYGRGCNLNEEEVKKNIDNQLANLGKISYEEKIVLLVFTLVIFGWSFKPLIPLDLSDASIGIIGVVILFLIPNKSNGDNILNWQDTKNLSWGTLLLFGGGLTLAKGLEVSGFVDLVGNFLESLSTYGYFLILSLVVIISIFLTEFITNLALISILLPFLAILSIQLTSLPISLTLPAAIASSCAFMMPVSTPPNAIIFSSGYIKIKDMIKIGFVCNLLATILIIFYFYNFIQ